MTTATVEHEEGIRDLAIRSIILNDPSIESLMADPIPVAAIWGVNLTEEEADRIRHIDPARIERFRAQMRSADDEDRKRIPAVW